MHQPRQVQDDPGRISLLLMRGNASILLNRVPCAANPATDSDLSEDNIVGKGSPTEKVAGSIRALPK